MDFDNLRLQIVSELQGYNVYFSHKDVPAEIFLPEQWNGFGLEDIEGINTPIEWDDFSGSLPSVFKWVKKCVVGTVLAVRETSYLAYIYLEDGEVSVYLGAPPLRDTEYPEIDKVPRSLRDFYTRLHNGFGFYIGLTMGPSPTKDYMCIQDLCDEDMGEIPLLLSFFSSGAGDYLAIEKKQHTDVGYIWWHEEPTAPDVDIDIWAVMDTWMAIFLENSDSNGKIIA
jgi:hypothetical protein